MNKKNIFHFLLILITFLCCQRSNQNTALPNGKYYSCNPKDIVLITDSNSFYKTKELISIAYLGSGKYHNDYFSMNIDYIVRDSIKSLITCETIKLHPSKNDSFIDLLDTITNSLIINRFRNDVFHHDPLNLKCIKGFSEFDVIYCNSYFQVYARNQEKENGVRFTDYYDKLTDSNYVFFKNIFDDEALFRFTRSALYKRGESIRDSLRAEYSHKLKKKNRK